MSMRQILTRQAVRWALLALVVGVIVFLFVLPGRIWLGQGRAATVAHHQDSALTRENAALAKRVAQLRNRAYIEQLARQEFGLVMPGEQAYALLPPTTPPTTAPPPRRH
jgi:cell division protein FtsB